MENPTNNVKMCRLCGEEKCSVTFFPCGHRIVCFECSRRINTCFECHQPINREQPKELPDFDYEAFINKLRDYANDNNTVAAVDLLKQNKDVINNYRNDPAAFLWKFIGPYAIAQEKKYHDFECQYFKTMDEITGIDDILLLSTYPDY